MVSGGLCWLRLPLLYKPFKETRWEICKWEGLTMSLIAAAAGQPAGEKDSNCDARRTTAGNGYSSQERSVRGAPIFRPESNTARPSQLYGPVTLARPWSSWVFVGITTVILVSGLIYAFLGSCGFSAKPRLTKFPRNKISDLQRIYIGFKRLYRHPLRKVCKTQWQGAGLA